MSDRPLPSSFDGNEDFYNERAGQKILRKLKEEPLIPLGAALTVLAFVQAYRAIRRGDSATANVMFRYRVGAQGFTVLAMVAGSLYYSKDRARTRELQRLQEQQKAEEKREKWIRELEARDDEDRAMRAAIERRRQGQQQRSDEQSAAPTSAAGGETTDGKKGSSGGVLAALGGSFWAKSTPKDDEATAAQPAAQPEPQPKKQRNPRSSLGDLGALINKKPDDKDNK